MLKRFKGFKFISIFLILLIFATVQSLRIVANNGNIDGDFTTSNYNNCASVENFNLVTSEGPLEVGESLNPNTPVTAQISVLNPDTIDDLSEIKFFFYYDTTDAATPGALTLDIASTTNKDGSMFMAQWTHNSTEIIADSTNDTSWTINAFTAPAIASDYAATSFVFEFEFTISKVANFTENEEWYMGTSIIDGRESINGGDVSPVIDKGLIVGSGSSKSLSPSAFNMNFYGEIIADGNQASASWPDMTAGDTFASDKSSTNVQGIELIANNDYRTQIKSGDHWEALITTEFADALLKNTELDDNSDAYSAFETTYNELFRDSDNPKSIGNNIHDLAGIKFSEANAVIDAIKAEETDWEGVEFLLPKTSADSNRTGASIATNPDVIGTDEFNAQSFLIGYETGTNGLSLTNTLTEADVTYGIIGTNDDWRPFLPDSLLDSGNQTQTDETGVSRNLTLYLYLSDVFQNAQYAGTISIQIVNDN